MTLESAVNHRDCNHLRVSEQKLASRDGALYSNTTGNNNTATGRWVLISNSNGSDNTATGTFALEVNQTGGENTATGNGALGNNEDGSPTLIFDRTDHCRHFSGKYSSRLIQSPESDAFTISSRSITH
jgi:hypothetical protein